MTALPLTVLVVDDTPMVGRLIKSYLARHAPVYTVHLCTTGADALTYLCHTPVAGVITDQTLSDTEGVTLARIILTRWPNVPVILFTGRLSPQLAAAARAVGCIATLEKPSGLAQLWPTLQSVLPSLDAYEVNG